MIAVKASTAIMSDGGGGGGGGGMSDGRRLFPLDPTKLDPPYPLLSACEAGIDPTVSTLISQNADVNMRSSEGWSALIMAAKEGHHRILTRLLAAGAHVNPPDITHTALRGASLGGHLGCVRTLLALSANPNLCSVGNKTPLMGACMHGHAAIVHALLEAGAEPTIVNEFGESARDLAVTHSHVECVAELDRPRTPRGAPAGSPRLERSVSSPARSLSAEPPLTVLTGGGSRDFSRSDAPEPPVRSPSLSPLRLPAVAKTLAGAKNLKAKAAASVTKNKELLNARASVARASVVAKTEVVRAKLKEEQRVSNGQLYLLTAATWLLIVLVICYVLVQVRARISMATTLFGAAPSLGQCGRSRPLAHVPCTWRLLIPCTWRLLAMCSPRAPLP